MLDYEYVVIAGTNVKSFGKTEPTHEEIEQEIINSLNDANTGAMGVYMNIWRQKPSAIVEKRYFIKQEV